MASFPVRAPLGPPLTGASNSSTPWSAQVACTSRTTAGEFVVRSNQALPVRSVLSRPSLPRPTSCISTGPGSEVKTTSTCRPSSATLSAQLAPACSNGCPLSLLMSCTTRSYPASRRLWAMPDPMPPRPMNPTFICGLPFGDPIYEQWFLNRNELTVAVVAVTRQQAHGKGCDRTTGSPCHRGAMRVRQPPRPQRHGLGSAWIQVARHKFSRAVLMGDERALTALFLSA